MSQIGDKIKEIEKNIQEGEMMLHVLRRLPESEETNAQVLRFEELVRKLEEYRNRYQNLESTSGEDLESKLQSLRAKQDVIQVLLEETAAGVSDSANCSAVVRVDGAAAVGEYEATPVSSFPTQNASPKQKTRARRDSDADTDEAEAGKERPRGSSPNHPREEEEDSERASDSRDIIEPSEWAIHFQAQVCQLSHMISQIERYEEMVNRLLELVNGLKLTQSASLLSDVLQRFLELRASLFSLQKAYDGLKAQENVSDGLRARQLTSIRDFLISLGRNLETTKNCFFSVANIVKRSISDHEEIIDPLEEEDNIDEVIQENEEDIAEEAYSLDAEDDVAIVKPISNGATVTVDADLEGLEQSATEKLENTLADLCKQRDALLHKLAESRSNSAASIFSTENKLNRLADFINSKQDTSQSSDLPMSAFLENSQAAQLDSLPILKKLQARKDHVEELRDELKAFCLQANIVDPTTYEANGEKTEEEEDTGESITPTPGRQLPIDSPRSHPLAPPRPQTVPTSTRLHYQNESERQVLDSCDMECNISSHLSKLAANGLMNMMGLTGGRSSSSRIADNQCGSQKTEVVTFQEPEATCLDDQERLYKRMREARIWQEEHRKNEAVMITSPAAINGVGNSHRMVNGHSTLRAPSDSTSHDQTAMATWGGSMEEEDADEDEDDDNAGYLENDNDNENLDDSAVSEKKLSVPPLIRTDLANSKPDNVNTARLSARLSTLPRLGHSPSPMRSTESHVERKDRENEEAEEKCIGAGASAVVNTDRAGRQHRQPHRTIQPTRANLTIFAEDESDCSGAQVAEAPPSLSILTQFSVLEGKVDHLTQICQLLISENTRLNTTVAFLMSNQVAANQATHTSHYPTQPGTANTDWLSCSSSNHAIQQSLRQTPVFMPPQTYPNFSSLGSNGPTVTPTSLFANLMNYPSYDVSSAPPAPACIMQQQPPGQSSPGLEKALDQVHSLTSQMIEQQSRVNQLQKDIALILNQHQNAPESAGDQQLSSELGGDPHNTFQYHYQSPLSSNKQRNHQPRQLLSPSINQIIAAATAAAQAQQLFVPQAWTSAVGSVNQHMPPSVLLPPSPFIRSDNQDLSHRPLK